MRIESENTTINYLSVKFDTKKHFELDKYFKQKNAYLKIRNY